MNIFSNMAKKEKLGLTIAAVIVFLAFFDRLIASPVLLKFKKINSETRMYEQQLAETLLNLNQKDDIAKDYQKYMQYIKSSYSEGETVTKLLEEVENMARSSGISIVDIKPQAPKQAEGYKYFLIEVEAEGKMETLVAFLHQLAGSKELLRASKVYITLKDKETSTVKASILITKVAVP